MFSPVHSKRLQFQSCKFFFSAPMDRIATFNSVQQEHAQDMTKLVKVAKIKLSHTFILNSNGHV